MKNRKVGRGKRAGSGWRTRSEGVPFGMEVGAEVKSKKPRRCQERDQHTSNAEPDEGTTGFALVVGGKMREPRRKAGAHS